MVNKVEDVDKLKDFGESYMSHICLIIEFSVNLFGYQRHSGPHVPHLRTTESLPEVKASRVTTRPCKSC
jgi:hypothetical protein